MQKRGQVTIFIILGIVVLALALLTVLIQQNIIFSSLQASSIEAEAALPEEKEIVAMLKTCIDDRTEEAVTLAGMQAGYVYIPEDSILPGPNNPFSNALIITGSMRVPYWRYEAANGIQKEQKPTIALIQSQLSDYVKKGIAGCAPDIASLYNLRATSEAIDVRTIIRDDQVTFLIDYQVTLESDTISVRTGEVVSVVDAQLGRLLGYAQQVLESQETFLEDRTIDILVLYDELPYSGTEFTCSPKVWTKPEVEKNFKAIVSENVENFRILDSGNKAGNKYFNWDAVSASNLKANFMYSSNWPTKIEVSPSEGQLLRGDSINQQINNEAAAYMNALFCITNYHFIYNIKYPVLMTLTDERTGYTLQIPMQVVIKNNQPRENKADLEDINLEPEICGDKGARGSVAAYEIQPDESLRPIEGAEIKFKCANTICPIGKTDSNGELIALFPECYNGFIIATKEGMLPEKQLFSTNEESDISLLVDPLYKIPVEIRVMDKGMERPLNDNEQAIIQLVGTDTEYSTSISQEQSEISIPPGTYTISTSLIQDSSLGITIESQKLQHCYKEPLSILGALGFTRTKCETTDIPATKLPQVLVGGSNAQWQAKRNKLSSAQKITFYVPLQKVPSNYDELTEVQESSQSSEGKAPVFE